MVHWRNVIFATWITFLMSTSFASGAAGSPPSLKNLLQGYEHATAFAQRVIYTAEIRSTSLLDGKLINPNMWGVSTDEHGNKIFRKFYRRDHDRLDILMLKPDFEPTLDNFLNPETHFHRIIVSDGNTTMVLAASEHRENASVISQSWKELTQSQLTLQKASMGLAGGDVLDGTIWGRPDKSLAKIFQEASDSHVKSQPEVVEGNQTWVVECTDASHTYRLWIDPLLDFHPRRIEERRIDSKGLGVDLTVESIQFGRVADRIIPMAAKISGQMQMPEHHVFQLENDYRRHDVDMNPQFERIGAFKMIAPADYQVVNLDFKEINWALKDGKLAPVSDPQGLKALKETIQEHLGNFGSLTDTPNETKRSTKPTELVTTSRVATVTPVAVNHVAWIIWGVIIVAFTGAGAYLWWKYRDSNSST